MPVITFSRYYPKGHPKAGQPTHFAEQILRGLSIHEYWSWFDNHNTGVDTMSFRTGFFYPVSGIKHHTIRAGNRWKVGDKFSPRVWSGKPYASKQIQFAPDIEIKKLWSIKSNGVYWWLNNKPISRFTLVEIGKNDGLELEDFRDWFKRKPFDGQIISWNESIQYP